LVFNDQLQHDLVEIRAMISAIALGDVHDVLRGLIVAVIATIDMETGAIEMCKARRQARALSGCGSKEAVEFRHPWSTDFGKTWLITDIRVDDQQSRRAAIKPQIAMLQDGAAVIAWEVTRQDRKEIAVKVLAPNIRQTSAC
jgi:hypothetical protein